MPTFSANPHIDYWPVGASLQPNNEFAFGSTTGWMVGASMLNSSSVLSSSTERAPNAITAGSAQVVTTATAASAATAKITSSAGGATWPTFASTDRLFIESYVKIIGTTGTVGPLTFNNNFVLVTSAGTYLNVSSQSARQFDFGAGVWMRSWSTMTGAQLIAVAATAGRVLGDVQLNIASASAGATVTWAIGKVNLYRCSATQVTDLMLQSGSTFYDQILPQTIAESPVTADIRQAVAYGPDGGPVTVS